jgi:hypothetical protein
VTVSPLIEGFTNVFASIVLGMKFGAIGVAAGTLIGGIVGMLGHIVYDMPRTRKEIAFNVRSFLFSAVGLPVLTATPLIALFIHTRKYSPPTPSVFAAACGITLLFVAAIFFRTESRKRI